MALGIRFPILQIVGYQNSGKTTLVEKIVQKGSEEGYKIATLKHHGHHTILDTVTYNKDSVRHRKAGAIVSVVEGGGSLQLEASTNDWKLEKLLQLYNYFEHDMILVEGYKTENYPKIVLIRSKSDIELLTCVTNIVGVVSWIPIETTYALFPINEDAEVLKWLFRSSEVNDEPK
ncbi:molybdopterin-guanine dinucleotide biosynthesis protein B [Fredinandcohnia humi]